MQSITFKKRFKLYENVEWSNSLLRHFKIKTLSKINCSMAAITAFGVTQHSHIFSLFFRNRIQCIALYQLHNSQALLNLRCGCYSNLPRTCFKSKSLLNSVIFITELHLRVFLTPCSSSNSEKIPLNLTEDLRGAKYPIVFEPQKLHT